MENVIDIDSVVLKKREYERLKDELSDFEEFKKHHCIIQSKQFNGYETKTIGFQIIEKFSVFKDTYEYYGDNGTIIKLNSVLNENEELEERIEKLKESCTDLNKENGELKSQIEKLKNKKVSFPDLVIGIIIGGFLFGIIFSIVG